VADDREMKYWLYRCYGCRRIITKLQLQERWQAAEKSGVDTKGICICGGGKLSPTNASVFEELTTPAIWKLWWVGVVLPKVKAAFGA